MGVFKKFNDLLRSNLNDWLDKAEDPEKMRQLAINEGEANLKKVRALLVSALASLKLAEAQKLDVSKEINDLVTKMKRDILSLETQLSKLKAKRFTADHVNDLSLFDQFDNLEEKINHQEAEAKIGLSLEDELEALKKKLKSDS